jgi:hypothetical protein
VEGLAKVIGIRVPAALGKRLEAQARRENNLVSSTARRLLTLALDREDEARSSPPPKRAA